MAYGEDMLDARSDFLQENCEDCDQRCEDCDKYSKEEILEIWRKFDGSPVQFRNWLEAK